MDGRTLITRRSVCYLKAFTHKATFYSALILFLQWGSSVSREEIYLSCTLISLRAPNATPLMDASDIALYKSAKQYRFITK